mmetsp:Transcript_31048/g.41031  ORF Transcript_31048/g.41031 Transcript_31048/m.41031 type:complete len:236 (-) Transcript_31048:407-1114(-)
MQNSQFIICFLALLPCCSSFKLINLSTQPPWPTTSNLRMAAQNDRMEHSQEPKLLSRQQFFGCAAAMATSTMLVPQISEAAPQQTKKVSDPLERFTFEVPSDWDESETIVSGGRKVVVFTNPQKPETNAFYAFTPLRGDYTSLGSFGTLDYVESVVLPFGPGVKSKLIESRSGNGMYYYDYTVEVTGKSAKRLKTIWAVVPDNLMTFTAQCERDDYDEYGSIISMIADSFSLSKK